VFTRALTRYASPRPSLQALGHVAGSRRQCRWSVELGLHAKTHRRRRRHAQDARLPAGLTVHVAHAHEGSQKVFGSDIGAHSAGGQQGSRGTEPMTQTWFITAIGGALIILLPKPVLAAPGSTSSADTVSTRSSSTPMVTPCRTCASQCMPRSLRGSGPAGPSGRYLLREFGGQRDS
jgi:hypothetical protein